MKFNSRTVAGQEMFTWLKRAKDIENSGKSVIHLEIGDPDFDTPQIAVDRCILALEEKHTHYVPSRGCDSLIGAAQKVTERSRGFCPSVEQLLVTPGANIQIYLALSCVCDVGSEVIIIRPYFPSYISQVVSIGAIPVVVDSAEDFGLDCKAIEQAITPSTRAIIINFPNNPSGAVYSSDDIRAVYVIAKKHDILLISDEVYSRMIFDRPFYSASMIDKCRDCVVVVNGFSKSHAMTGWRLGVVTGPEPLIERMRILQETILSCVPPFIQEAGAALLLNDQREQAQMMTCTKGRAYILTDLIEHMIRSVKVVEPHGGLYCLAKIQNGMNSEQYCSAALDRGVALAPGTMFGMEGHVRFAYVKRTSAYSEAAIRLESL